jgi:transposase
MFCEVERQEIGDVRLEWPSGQYGEHMQKMRVSEAARRLSISMKTLANWVHAGKAGKLAHVGQHQRPLTEIEAELARVKRELAEVKMERDLLKKCTAYFAKESR